MSIQPRELFISHSSQNQGFVDRLVHVLVEHGIPVWYSKRDILGAQQWHDEIGRALARCDWFAVVLSPASVESSWVKRELMYALNHPRYGDHILPILYQNCSPAQLSWTLPSFQYIDFRGSFSRGCEALLRAWGIGFRG